MNIPAFRLYGLLGCVHCENAERFLRERLVPAEFILATGDPIINEGVKKLTNKDEFPILLYRPTKEIVVGFKKEEYERLVTTFGTLVSASAPSAFGGRQQHIPAVPPTPAATQDSAKSA